MASVPLKKSVITLQSDLHKFSDIRYAAYRTAAKLQYIQNYTNLNHVKLSNVLQAFEALGLRATERELVLLLDEINTLLLDIFRIAQKEVLINLYPRQSCVLIRDLLTAIYDRVKKKSGCSVLCVQVFLTILCSSGSLSDKYRSLLRMISNHNQCVSQRELALLLKAITSVAEFVNEAPAFGNWTVLASVQQCFEQSGGMANLTEDAVFAWLIREPQSLVWWSSLYRLNTSHNVVHTIRCSACNTYPIQGLRYHCSDCFGYSQCQNCFWSGRVSKNHKLNHSVQEYCTQTTAKETTRTVFKKLRNWFSSKNPDSGENARYLPLKTAGKEASESVLQVVNETEAIYEDLTFKNDPADLNQTGLTTVLGHLISEHGKLQNYINRAEVPQPVLEHCDKLETQLERLQQLMGERKNRVGPLPRPPMLTRLESTPLLRVIPSQDQSLPFSPIAAGTIAPGKENAQPGMRRLEPGRFSLRSCASSRVATNGTLNYCTPRLGRKSFQTTPRITTDHTLDNLSHEYAHQGSGSTGMTSNPFGETSDTQMSAELEEILSQLENLFPNKQTAPVPQNVTITKATNEVANAFAEFVDGFH